MPFPLQHIVQLTTTAKQSSYVSNTESYLPGTSGEPQDIRRLVLDASMGRFWILLSMQYFTVMFYFYMLYYMSKKSWLILYSKLQYDMGQDLLDTQ